MSAQTQCESNTIRLLSVGALLVFLLVVVLTILVQANPGTRGLGRDQGFYVYIGDEIVHGRLPYADAWEGKPPAIFYLNALGLWLGRGSRWGVWALELITLLLAFYLGYELMRRKWGVLAALFGTGLAALGLDRTFYGGGNFTEEYPLPLHLLGILAMLELFKAPGKRMYSFAIGVLFAVVFLFRPNNAAPEAAMVLTMLVLWLSRRQYRALLEGLACMAAGAALILLVPVVYFWSKGLLADLIDASLLYHVEYEGASSPSSMVLWTGYQVLGIGVAVAIVGYVLILLGSRRASEDRLLYVFLLIGWPLTMSVTDPAHKGFAHYYINWLPFVALFSAYALHWLQVRLLRRESLSHHLERVLVPGAALVALAVLILSGRASEYGRVLDRFRNRAQQGIEFRSPTAIYAENHTRPGDKVLFWSAWPGENYMADRESSTAALYYPFYMPSAITTWLSERFLQDLKEQKPVLIVDMGHVNTPSLDPAARQRQMEQAAADLELPLNTADVLAYIDQNYHRVAVVKGRSIYRLNGTE